MSDVEILGKPISYRRKFSVKDEIRPFKPIDNQEEKEGLKLDLIYERDETEANENF